MQIVYSILIFKFHYLQVNLNIVSLLYCLSVLFVIIPSHYRRYKEKEQAFFLFYPVISFYFYRYTVYIFMCHAENFSSEKCALWRSVFYTVKSEVFLPYKKSLQSPEIRSLQAYHCRQWDLNPHVVAHNRF